MSELLRTAEDGVVTLTLHRPESRNALTTGLLRALLAALDDIQDSPGLGALVLCGAGGTFCAGADLKEFATSPSAEGSQRRIRLVTEVLARIRNLEQPTVAVVTGAAYGAGWGLALACDLAVASPSARFSLPEVPKGLRLPTAITTRLVEVVGPVRAAEIALGGGTYGPDEGVALGWLTRALPDDESAHAHAGDLAARVAASPRSSVTHVKRVLRRGSPYDLTPPPEYAWNEEK